MTPVYIALGSNLQSPADQLRTAVAALDNITASHVERISPVYRSAAVGPGPQPDYLNAAVLLHTALAPNKLLDALQRIEQEQGRVRALRWGARTLDLDILLYGDMQISTARLTVPHQAMRRRNFVLFPLIDISGAHLVLPDGTDLGTLVAQCPAGDLVKTDLQLGGNHCRMDLK